jgi:hypothetical protein
MLALTLFRDMLLATVPYDTHAYTTDWCLTTRFLLVSHACAGLAVYRAIGRLYPKIGAFAAGLFAGCLLIASALTLGTLWWETRDISGQEFLLRSTFLLWRWVDGITAGALALAVVFLARFPRPLKRMPSNLTWHAALLAAYFASSSLLYLCENLTPLGQSVTLERIDFTLVAVLYSAWTLALSRAGETSEPWPQLDPAIVLMAEQSNHRALAAYGWLAK